MAVWHAKEEVGCMDCHGPSLAHRNDEDNITPPDKMFPPGAIDESCGECHDSHDVPAVKVIARWQARCPKKTDAATVVCTDCHGHHRLEKRVVRWNKETGELLLNTSEKE
jgi:formate-dependent nitrite reductase cytochrome c552 subunit